MRIRRIRRRGGARSRSAAPAPQETVTLRAARDESPAKARRIVLVGDPIFNVRLRKLLAAVPDLEIAGEVTVPRVAPGASAVYAAELVVVDIDFGGTGGGVIVARSMMDRDPGTAIMMVAKNLNPKLARHYWIYGTESWSFVTSATANNAEHLNEAINSAVRGMTWVEPGVKRILADFGKRPKSVEERRDLLLGHGPGSSVQKAS